MKTTILLLSLFMMMQSSCNKNDDGFTPTLPPITQTGENTFGAYINGRLLTPRSGATGSLGHPASGMLFSGFGEPPNYFYNQIEIKDFKSGTGGLMDIHIIDLHENGEGTFVINESNCFDGIDANPSINIRCRWWDEATQLFKWYCSIENGGTITITHYDFENRIVSGTFSTTAVNEDNPDDIIEITQGRFDINWGTLTAYTEFP